MNPISTGYVGGVGLEQAGFSPNSATNSNQLEAYLQTQLLDDINGQLSELTHSMETQLAEKKVVREDVNFVQGLVGRTPNANEIELTQEEVEKLKSLGVPEDSFTDKGDGKYTIARGALESSLQIQKEKLAGLNSDTEMLALKVQSLTDQRKMAFSMLTNLLANDAEIKMSIVRNLKS